MGEVVFAATDYPGLYDSICLPFPAIHALRITLIMDPVQLTGF